MFIDLQANGQIPNRMLDSCLNHSVPERTSNETAVQIGLEQSDLNRLAGSNDWSMLVG